MTTESSSLCGPRRWLARPHHQHQLLCGLLLLTALSLVTNWLALRFGAGQAATRPALLHIEWPRAAGPASPRNAAGAAARPAAAATAEEGADAGGEGATATAAAPPAASRRGRGKAKARKSSEDRAAAAEEEAGREAEEEKDRRGALEAAAGIFSYVHISKCGGASWIKMLQQLHGLDVYPQHRTGQEFSVHHQRKRLGRRAAYHLTTLRSPRHHVYSLFRHCKYYRHANFTNTWAWGGEDRADFRAWLDHHVPLGPHNRGRHRCEFHPANYQARHLTSRAARPHGLGRGGRQPFAPDASEARRAYRALDFVGLTEFTHEARCLLYHRLEGSALPEALAYVDEACRCGAPGRAAATAAAHRSKAAKGTREVHVTHHDGPHQSALRDFPREVLSQVDVLTRTDVAVYVLALRQFLAEVAWLESDAALGRRVLCDTVLSRLEPELRYLPAAEGRDTNVTQLYWEATRGSSP